MTRLKLSSGVHLRRVEHQDGVRFLGVEITNDLTWKTHIETMHGQAAGWGHTYHAMPHQEAAVLYQAFVASPRLLLGSTGLLCGNSAYCKHMDRGHNFAKNDKYVGKPHRM